MKMAKVMGVVVAVSGLLVATQGQAAVTYTQVTAASSDIKERGHTSLESQISNIDLINVGQPSLSSTTNGMPLYSSSPATHLNNGYQFEGGLNNGAGAYYGNSTTNDLNYSYIPKIGATWDVILSGKFSISKIVSYTGTEAASSRTTQKYTVAFSTNGGVTFAEPTIFVDKAYGSGAAMQVTIENPGSVLATNVNAIRFTFSAERGGKEAAYREIDVFQAPEPATMSLLALGGLATLIRRRNRR